MLIEKELELFLEDAFSTMRVIDNNIHYVKCSHCGNMIELPIVARREDVDNIKLLADVMKNYIGNDSLYKARMMNFVKDLHDLKEKYSK